MLRWSIHLFRVAGINLGLHWSFLLLLGYAAWAGAEEAGWLGLVWVTSFILLLFTCVVAHELGHCLVARRFGVQVGRILLLPIGGMAEFDRIPRRPGQEMAIAIAGPLVNFLLVGLLLLAGVRFPPGWDIEQFPLTLAELGRHLVVVNIIMGCFNLVPVFPMDGGRIFRALLALRLPYLRATFVAATVGKILAVIGATVMIFAFDNWLGALLFGFIFLVGELEYRAVRRRELEDAYWSGAARWAQSFYASPPRVIEVRPAPPTVD
jgi:Zn-dependent protease